MKGRILNLLPASLAALFLCNEAGAEVMETKGSTLTVAAVASRSVFGDVEANLAHFETHVREAAAAGARLICFPELALVGYTTHPDVLKSAEPIPGFASDGLARIAGKYNIYISAGMAERDGEHHYISQILAGPEGYLGNYRKCFPTSGEKSCGFDSGKRYSTWDIDGFRFGIVICMDGRFEETIQAMKQASVDVIHHPHGNFMGPRGRESEEWSRGHLVYIAPRAITARAHTIANNSAEDMIDPTGTRRYGSGALVIDALGQVVSRTMEKDRAERMLVVTLEHPLASIPPGELDLMAKKDPDFKRRVERYREVHVKEECT